MLEDPDAELGHECYSWHASGEKNNVVDTEKMLEKTPPGHPVIYVSWMLHASSWVQDAELGVSTSC